MELAELLALIRRRWGVVVLASLVVAATGLLTADTGGGDEPVRRQVTEFSATQTLVRSTDGPITSSQVSLPLLARLAETGEVPAAVIEELALDTTSDVLAGRMQVIADTSLGTLTVSTTGTDEEEIVRLVDAYTEQLMNFASQRNESLRQDSLERLRRLVEGQEIRIRELTGQLGQTSEGTVEWQLIRAERDALVNTYSRNLEQMEELVARPASDPGVSRLGSVVAVPVSTSVFAPAPVARLPRTAAAAVLGALLGLGLAFVVDRSDRRLLTADQVESAYGLPLLAEIELPGQAEAGRPPEDLLDLPTGDEAAQAFARLGILTMRSSVGQDEESGLRRMGGGETPERGRKEPLLVMLTSAGPMEGRTTSVVQIAAALAATGRRVVVSGIGVHWQQASSALKVQRVGERRVRPTSIPGVLVTDDDLSHAGVTRPWVDDGTPLHGVDVVLVDAGPLLESGNAAALATEVDRIVIVARAGRTQVAAARRASAFLERLGAPVTGVALLRFSPVRPWERRDQRSAKAIHVPRARAAQRSSGADGLAEGWTSPSDPPGPEEGDSPQVDEHDDVNHPDHPAAVLVPGDRLRQKEIVAPEDRRGTMLRTVPDTPEEDE